MMKDDVQIKCEGMDILVKELGLVEAGRFISLIQQDHFDYTEWRRNFYENKTLEEIFPEAAAFRAKILKEEKAKKPAAKSGKATPAKRTVRKPAAKRKPAGRKQLVPA